MTRSVFYALNRFGLGARAGEAATITDPKKYLLDQIASFDSTPTAYALQHTPADINAYRAETFRRSPWTGQKSVEVPEWDANNWHAVSSSYFGQGVRKRFEQAIRTNTPFVERLMHFWSNHFACEEPGHMVGHEFHHIRPFMTGKFADLVISASCRSPAMLAYLTQWNSYGPRSPMANGRNGLNENLGREILELHTIGVNGGYTQQDVEEMSRALTGLTCNGWVASLQPIAGVRLGTPIFDSRMHEPGDRTVLGKTYTTTGFERIVQIINDLCASDACAYFVSTKLVTHFFGDNPPQWAVDRVARTWQTTGGLLTAVYTTLVETFFDNIDNTDIQTSKKFRNRWEWCVAAGRYFLSVGIANIDAVAHGTNGFALERASVWRPGSPAGYPDITTSITTNEMFWRVNKFQYLFKQFPGIVGSTMPLDVAPFSQTSIDTIRGMGNTNTAIPYFLTTPEMTWR